MFSPAELHKILAESPVDLGGMILLGINAGFGNTDCSKLPEKALELDDGWINFPRPKTGINRRCKLWPETVEALRESLSLRPQPKVASYDKLVFLRVTGEPWGFSDRLEWPLTKLFNRIIKQADAYQPGRGFSALRKTFRTVASEHLDEPAADLIMGHGAGDMASIYRQTISDKRLAAVSDHVRKWLWPDAAE